MLKRALLLLLAVIVTDATARRVPEERPTDTERGRELYERHCLSCHGARNHGDGPATKALVHVVPDLAGKVEATPDTIDLVRSGQGAMPGYAASIMVSDVRRLLRYMAKVHEEPDLPEDPAPEEPPAEPGD